MINRFTVVFFIFTLTFEMSAFAGPRGNGAMGIRKPIINGDRLNREEGSGYWEDNAVPAIILEDPNAAEERRKAEIEKREKERQKAINSHNDPGGGFFNEDQSPKELFSKE